jgi:hypothetical protein
MSTFEELQQRAAKKGMYLRIAKPEGYAVGLTGSNGWELSTTYVSNLKDAEHFIARRESFLKKDAELQPSKYKSDPAKAEAKRMLWNAPTCSGCGKKLKYKGAVAPTHCASCVKKFPKSSGGLKGRGYSDADNRPENW